MSEQNRQTLMDQRIFEIGLPVETVSVYLLCTGLSESGKELTVETLSSVWNGSQETLIRELMVLEEKGIVRSFHDDSLRYRVQSSDQWR